MEKLQESFTRAEFIGAIFEAVTEQNVNVDCDHLVAFANKIFSRNVRFLRTNTFPAYVESFMHYQRNYADDRMFRIFRHYRNGLIGTATMVEMINARYSEIAN